MVKLLMGIAGWVLSPLMSLFDFPVVPDSLHIIIGQMFDYMSSAMGLLNFFLPLNLIKPCIDIFIAVYLIEFTYKIVMWVLKKIPMLGIS